MKTTKLLWCGILSSLLYVVMNILCDIRYEGYNSASQTVSELSAIGSPVRSLWVSFAVVHSLLGIAFGLGVWLSAKNTWLQLAGILLVANSIIGVFWPPMHQREVLAAGGGTLTDTLHIVFTIISVSVMMVVMVLSAVCLDKPFRVYSAVSLLVMLVFGIVTALQSPDMEANLSTPLIGVWERISIGAYMLWIVVLARKMIRYNPLQLHPISQKQY
ncbi:DUF998 domain-containing protein [Flavihumibacter solisilvae]|uniref:DUF998 domain-containing protein n=1 Tax=Flavihumibacter solisilvae TaxID=1349421 RepID=UPI00090782E0|nr:DUF998 domain-containing protein [Flavihumibacter solisilvae]